MKLSLSSWQVAATAALVSTVGGLMWRGKRQSEKESYKQFEQAPWSPPSWLFGPAWIANNYFLIKALQKIVNGNHEKRKLMLGLQVPIWVIFFSFGYVYAKKKSPVLATAWTATDAALAAASFGVAVNEDKKLASHFLPLLGWTSFASSLAIFQAKHNDDPFLKTKALAEA